MLNNKILLLMNYLFIYKVAIMQDDHCLQQYIALIDHYSRAIGRVRAVPDLQIM